MHFHLHGYGYVGRAVVNKFAKRDTFTIFDPLYTELKTDADQKYDGVIVCVPTPEDESGSCDFTQVSKVVKQYDKQTPILIKSTISQEAADHLADWNITFNPEFLRAETADTDYENQTHIYIGGGDTEFWEMVFFRHFAKAYISKSDISTKDYESSTQWLRFYLDLESRSQLKTNIEAQNKLDALYREYTAWKPIS